MLWFHNHGYGNSGATSGHLIPDYAAVIQKGWESIYEDIEKHYEALSEKDQRRQDKVHNYVRCAQLQRWHVTWHWNTAANAKGWHSLKK